MNGLLSSLIDGHRYHAEKYFKRRIFGAVGGYKIRARCSEHMLRDLELIRINQSGSINVSEGRNVIADDDRVRPGSRRLGIAQLPRNMKAGPGLGGSTGAALFSRARNV